MFARACWSWEREPGVPLPDEEPVGLRKRETPSAGMLGSLANVLSLLCTNAGDPLEPEGVIVADTDDICGAALCGR